MFSNTGDADASPPGQEAGYSNNPATPQEAEEAGYSNSSKSLEDATYEELATALNGRLDMDRRQTSRQFDDANNLKQIFVKGHETVVAKRLK